MTIVVKEREKVAGLRPLKQPLYDTVQFAHNTATTRLPFFATPQGNALTAAINKNAAHTNLKQAGRIGKPQQFEMYGLQMDIVFDLVGAGDAVALISNMKLVYETGAFEFFFGQQFPWVQVPAYQIPNGYRMLGDVCTQEDTGGTEYAWMKNGIGGQNDMFEVGVAGMPIPVEYSETFGALLSYPGGAITLTITATTEWLFCVYMKGILYKSL